MQIFIGLYYNVSIAPLFTKKHDIPNINENYIPHIYVNLSEFNV